VETAKAPYIGEHPRVGAIKGGKYFSAPIERKLGKPPKKYS